MPTLVIWGGQDRVIWPGFAEQLNETLPDAELLFVPDAGHLVFLEHVDAVIDAVTTRFPLQ